VQAITSQVEARRGRSQGDTAVLRTEVANDVYRKAAICTSPPWRRRTGWATPGATTWARSPTLCAGCGHDSISAGHHPGRAWELDIEPHGWPKLSGIGCSSKTPDYFLGRLHGFNTVHGRMPSVLTGANLANRDLLYLGRLGDGDSASIGLGSSRTPCAAACAWPTSWRTTGLRPHQGQFSATADSGSKSKKGVVNSDSPVDLVAMALQLGATYVGRASPATRRSWCR
jgi:pyruvate/2-oxoacid:ferredoxin oxidoreductase beta subunit